MPTTRLPVLLLLLSAAAPAASLFDDDAILDIELAGPIARLIADTDDRARHPVTLRLGGRDFGIEARVRGKSRSRVCDFPPIRLYFDDAEVDGTAFADQSKLKLVTHCRDTDAAEANVLDELAAYRIFAALSDASYRTRLARIRYTDSDPDSRPATRVRYAFLIESDDELATRLGAVSLELEGVTRSEIDDEQAALVYVFQYLIGNTDWSLVRADGADTCCHNIDLFRVAASTYPVPYDFDLSGLVDAPYAEPDPSLRLRSVRQRRYRGYCVPSTALEAAIERVAARREAIFAAVATLPTTARDARRIEAYLESYFDRAARPDRLLRRFERHCL